MNEQLSQKEIYTYNLISFSKPHIDARAALRAMDEQYAKLNVEERAVYSQKVQKERTELRNATSIGKAYRGSFLDLDLLINVIESPNDPYGICEGYYDYLCIEKRKVDAIDSYCSVEDEIWYFSNFDAQNFKYSRIEKPVGMVGLFGFT
jgi:hypothetical protein